jgi:hypothetical protein
VRGTSKSASAQFEEIKRLYDEYEGPFILAVRDTDDIFADGVNDVLTENILYWLSTSLQRKTPRRMIILMASVPPNLP